MDWLNIREISEVIGKNIWEISLYLQYIIFKVDLLLKNEKSNINLEEYIKKSPHEEWEIFDLKW